MKGGSKCRSTFFATAVEAAVEYTRLIGDSS